MLQLEQVSNIEICCKAIQFQPNLDKLLDLVKLAGKIVAYFDVEQ